MTESPSLFLDTLSAFRHTFLFPGGVFALIAGLLLMGLDAKMVARLQRRRGGPLLQPFFDCIKLLLKVPQLPEHNKSLYVALPVCVLFLTVAGASLLPVAGISGASAYKDDALFFYCLLVLPSLLLMMGGLAFPATYRKVALRRDLVTTLTYAVPLGIVLYCVALRTGGGSLSFSFRTIVAWQEAHGPLISQWEMLPAVLAYLLALPAAMKSTPFAPSDGEVESLGDILGEYSGALLSLFAMGRAIRLFSFLSLGIVFFWPTSPDVGVLPGLLLSALKCCVIMVIGLTVVKGIAGSFRVRQVAAFCWRGPFALALCSLLFVWLSL